MGRCPIQLQRRSNAYHRTNRHLFSFEIEVDAFHIFYGPCILSQNECITLSAGRVADTGF